MSDLQFTEDTVTRRVTKLPKPTLPERLVRWGVAGDVAAATKILYVIIGIAFLIIVYNVVQLTSGPADVPIEDPGAFLEV